MLKTRKMLSAAAASLALAGGGLVLTPAAAQASSLQCSVRTSGNTAYAGCWGSGAWRLAISCTWSYSGKTAPINQYRGYASTSKTCGWGSMRSAWIELL